MIERDDPGGHAERLVHGVVQPAGRFRHGPAAHLERQARHVPDLADGEPDVVPHLVQRAAVVERVEPRQLLAARFDRVGEGEQRGRALLGLGRPPAGGRPFRGRHGDVDVALIAPGNAGDDLVGRGVDDVQGGSGDRGNAFAVDQSGAQCRFHG